MRPKPLMPMRTGAMEQEPVSANLLDASTLLDVFAGSDGFRLRLALPAMQG
jgi:hypothetical protein